VASVRPLPEFAESRCLVAVRDHHAAAIRRGGSCSRIASPEPLVFSPATPWGGWTESTCVPSRPRGWLRS